MREIINNNGIINDGIIQGNIGDVTVTTVQNGVTINWHSLKKELDELYAETAVLYAAQLPPSTREFAAGMKQAYDSRDETKLRQVCGKFGKYMLDFVQSLGLELLANLIVTCIL